MSVWNHKKYCSYDTEPSLGSVAPLSDETDSHVSDKTDMFIPFPRTTNCYENSSKNQSTLQSECISLSNKDDVDNFFITLPNYIDVSPDKLPNNNSLHSSHGTPFKGFNNNSYDELQTVTIEPVNSSFVTHIDTEKSDASGVTFAKFYDMVAEENSCNAVDLKISTENISNIVTPTSIASKHLNPFKFSFNGKITSIASPMLTDSLLLEKSCSDGSFIPTIYKNEKSPDLFDNDDNVDEIIIDNNRDKSFNSKVMLKCSSKTHNIEEEQNFASINKYSNHAGPSLFSIQSLSEDTRSINCTSFLQENCRREEVVLQRIRKCLEGLPPPPSVTILQLDMFSTVLSHKEKILDFFQGAKAPPLHEEELDIKATKKSLFRPTHPLDTAKAISWREALGVRQHGFCFNLCGASESNEYLALSVIERFVGCETASSYRNSPSSAKKRNARMKLITQSPGNRLSHLARRRATFSSAHLATTSQKTKSLLGHQILLDKKKNKHRRKCTPKRMTPGSKKKNRKTPSSSSHKGATRSDLLKIGPLREASKRALFQSPTKDLLQVERSLKKLSNLKPEIANRIEKSKRALFSTETLLQSDSVSESEIQTIQLLNYTTTETSKNICSFQINSVLKRKRDLQEEHDSIDLPSQSSKLFRGGAENLTPRALKIKSQSFCIGANVSSATDLCDLTVINRPTSSTNITASLHNNVNLYHNQSKTNASTSSGKIQRARSDMTAQTNSLTENQRKKLLWAVSQALQEKKVSTKHEHFKQYAAVLARIVRRLFQEYFQKNSVSNSETMLRLAKRYVHNVINGNNADDIYLQAKAKIGKDKLQPSLRLSGYIGPEEYERRKMSMAASYNINESDIPLPISPSKPILMAKECISRNMTEEVFSHHSKKLPVQPNPSLQNSSSKNNNCGLALRENVNFEYDQRRSGQKNFTGKDQRNVSPYAILGNSKIPNKRSVTITKKEIHNVSESSLLCDTDKVKRQITFDN